MTDEKKSPVTITRLGSIGVPVTNQDRALEFYAGLLGLEKRRDADTGNGWRWLEIAPPEATTSIALVPTREDAPVGIETGIRLLTPDAEAAHAALVTHGADVDAEIMRWGGGVPPMFYVRDPDGNKLVIVEG
ncbi:VOC family protein [Streptomyces sp. NBC_01465]|uniref:VOC family protein n=1 Tax=Streptomyces sp. NBC_01465 TaxID=2903878 RepID=UPI002E30337A|nr:VOC family protein [Streptomyces sp. NBC_01465]